MATTAGRGLMAPLGSLSGGMGPPSGDEACYSPQRRRDAELSAENALVGWGTVRGVWFDAEARRRGERRGDKQERGKTWASDSRVNEGCARRQRRARREERPSFARMHKAEPYATS